MHPTRELPTLTEETKQKLLNGEPMSVVYKVDSSIEGLRANYEDRVVFDQKIITYEYECTSWEIERMDFFRKCVHIAKLPWTNLVMFWVRDFIVFTDCKRIGGPVPLLLQSDFLTPYPY